MSKETTFKQVNDLSELQSGAIIKNAVSENTYVVISNYGTHVTAVKSIDVTNPAEWLIVTEVEKDDLPFCKTDFAIAIRADGKEFRCPKDAKYGDSDFPDYLYSLQFGNKKCAFRFKYFDIHGFLRKEFLQLEFIEHG